MDYNIWCTTENLNNILFDYDNGVLSITILNKNPLSQFITNSNITKLFKYYSIDFSYDLTINLDRVVIRLYQFNMRLYKYFMYVVRHKIKVNDLMRNKFGIQDFSHDFSKFSDLEFVQYAKTFFDDDGNSIEKPNTKTDMFRVAVNHHYQWNPHHLEYWKGKENQMPVERIYEMYCDWSVVSEYKNGDLKSWYLDEIKRKSYPINITNIMNKLLGV